MTYAASNSSSSTGRMLILLLIKFYISLSFYVIPCHVIAMITSEEKDDALSAISGGSLKPEISGHPTTTTNVTVTTPTLTTSSITASAVPTETPEVDEEEYSVKPQDNSWNKNSSPQKS